MKEKHDNFEQRYKESKIAMKVFFKLADLWYLSSTQQLSLLGADIVADDKWLQQWEETNSAEPLSDEQLSRVTMLINIRYSLDILFGESKVTSPWNGADVLRSNTWLFAPNKAKGFQGLPALDLMIAEGYDGIKFVNDYLLAQLN